MKWSTFKHPACAGRLLSAHANPEISGGFDYLRIINSSGEGFGFREQVDIGKCWFAKRILMKPRFYGSVLERYVVIKIVCHSCCRRAEGFNSGYQITYLFLFKIRNRGILQHCL